MLSIELTSEHESVRILWVAGVVLEVSISWPTVMCYTWHFIVLFRELVSHLVVIMLNSI